MADHHLHITINLAAMTGRVQRLLKAATNMVVIGLTAATAIDPDITSAEDSPRYHEFDASTKWTKGQAQEAWTNWILRNAFRDVAEAISGILEEVQTVLSTWALIGLQKSQGHLQGHDYNELVTNRGLQFHKRNLPHKLEFLQKEYQFEVDSNLAAQVLTINAARNCLVHRGGLVSQMDADASGALTLRWSALTPIVVVDGKEKEIELPYLVEAGTEMAIATRPRSKAFQIGQHLTVTSSEFKDISWTLFLFALSCAKALEAHGKVQGLEFKANVT